jgi:hypothetical protein
MGIIGLGNKGRQHAKLFASLPGVRVTALCEVDPERLSAQRDRFKASGSRPFATTDPRRVIEREDVDAVVIATPNHWHALLTVWALRAGKDVYVEKPVSHNVAEGVRMVEEARARGLLVQGGLQYRSCPGLRAAATWLKEGHLGRLLWAYLPWYEHRPPIGKCAPFVPKDLDYDLWCGPAPFEPLTRPKLHYDWHWIWSTGDGDMGNSTVHPFDACRMFLPYAGFPKRIMSVGGRFTYEDAGQTPNTQFTLMEYPELPVVIENRNLSMVKGEVVMDRFRGVREGMVLQYEGGYFAGFRSGGKVFDSAGKELRHFRGDNGKGHQANFLKAWQNRRIDDLNAPILESHVSSAVCHLANLSYRMGQPQALRGASSALGESLPVREGFPRLVKSLEGLGVDLDQSPFNVGPWLELDPASGGVLKAGGGSNELREQVERLWRGSYRQPYVMPA